MKSKNDQIIIRGARENNLQNIDLTLPKNSLIVMTGVSGSGKTSLAFDTIYAEGQRRYVESLSAYARQFLDNVNKPDVDQIEGLSPSISIDQKTTSKNPRSTVGTVTEIYDYLRLLYARIGRPTCPTHGIEISAQTYEEMVDKLFTYPLESKLVILGIVAQNQKGTFEKTFDLLRKDGYTKIMIGEEMYDLDTDTIELDKNKKHDILVVIDRLKLRPENRSRIYEAIELASTHSNGKLYVDVDGERMLFSEHYACPYCDFTVPRLEPAMFSFNSPLGACPECKGLGVISSVDINLLVTDPDLSIAEGAIRYLKNIVFTENIEWQQFKKLCEVYQIDLFKPFKDLTDLQKDVILHGSKEAINYEIHTTGGIIQRKNKPIEGIASLIERRYQETTSSFARDYYASYLADLECPKCHGKRLSDTILAVLIGGKNIYEFTQMSITEALDFLNQLQLTEMEQHIAHLVLKEIKERLNFLKTVGLEYLTLSRKAGSLSGGEAQRIRLATQIGSHLTDVLYVLDEPSIGLHQRDNQRLIDALKVMRDNGNTLVVVEHDEEIMRQADYLVDIGPGAGVHGGKVVACGTPEEVAKAPNSITADYLSGRKKIEVPTSRRSGNGKTLSVIGATENNLKHLNVDIPLNTFTCVTGVSGSGKSTLVNDIIASHLMKKINHAKIKVGSCEAVLGDENLDKVIVIDQSPIGRTPRSNPATYTGVFDLIRDCFASCLESQKRGYTKGRFSFNVKGGRCEACQGDGVIRIAMHFLPDVYIPCSACHGKRYNRETLDVKYHDKSIADVLDMTIEDALAFFNHHPQIKNRLETLVDVGLGYLTLGQSSTTLSGGEAQRVKLASELYKKVTKGSIYILDEPTTGLHTDDIKRLIQVLNRLVDAGGTVLVIEHNLDVIKVADYIIDLGPEGGDAGGCVITTGTPEEVAKVKESFTGQFLKKVL